MRTRSDEQVRREVLVRAGWRPDEIDGYLAAHPKPDTAFEQQAILRERVLDALYALCVTLRIPALVRRLGMRPRQWVRDREIESH